MASLLVTCLGNRSRTGVLTALDWISENRFLKLRRHFLHRPYIQRNARVIDFIQSTAMTIRCLIAGIDEQSRKIAVCLLRHLT